MNRNYVLFLILFLSLYTSAHTTVTALNEALKSPGEFALSTYLNSTRVYINPEPIQEDPKEKKYGKTKARFSRVRDSVQFDYAYMYDEPNVNDEEYSETVQIKMPDKLLSKGKRIELGNGSVRIKASHSGAWARYDYSDLKGDILILNCSKKRITLTLNITGRSSSAEKRDTLVGKTLIFTR